MAFTSRNDKKVSSALLGITYGCLSCEVTFGFCHIWSLQYNNRSQKISGRTQTYSVKEQMNLSLLLGTIISFLPLFLLPPNFILSCPFAFLRLSLFKSRHASASKKGRYIIIIIQDNRAPPLAVWPTSKRHIRPGEAHWWRLQFESRHRSPLCNTATTASVYGHPQGRLYLQQELFIWKISFPVDTRPWLSYQDTNSFESRPLQMGSDTQCQETDRCEFHLKCDVIKYIDIMHSGRNAACSRHTSCRRGAHW